MIKENRYTVFLTYFSGLIFIIGLNYLFRWTVDQIQSEKTNFMFLIYIIPLLEGIIIGMTAITIYRLQLLITNKYFVYVALAIFGATLLIPKKASGFVILYLGATVFSALIASLRKDNLNNSQNKKLKSKNKIKKSKK